MVEVLIEERRLDVFEEFDFSFNYAIADIRNPDKRSTEFSKTIKCPATKGNDELLGHIYDFNISNPYNSNQENVFINFNPNKRAEARVLADGVEVMAGVMQLRKIIQKDQSRTYEVVFIGNLINIFSVLADKELNELDDSGAPYIDFSDLDHRWNYQEVTSSWSNTTGYVYPMLDYGVDEPFYINGNRYWRLEQFRPAVFLYNIIDRIFSYANFSYTSTFLTSSFFRRLIVPFNNEGFVVTDSSIARRAMTSTVQNIIDVNSEFYPNYPIFGNYQDTWRVQFDQLSDPFNNWSNQNSEYTVPEDGFYTFAANLKWETTRIYNPPFPVSASPIDDIYSVNVSYKRYEVATGQITTIANAFHYVRGDYTYTIGAQNTETFAYSCPTIELGIGDRIWLEVGAYTVNAVEFQTNIIEGFISDGIGGEEIVQGQFIPMNALVPNIGMAEMLMSVFKMINLYVEVDPNNERNLLIETRDDFYKAGGTKDWTYKLARDRDISVQPTSAVVDKRYIYTYKDDKDFDNFRYESKYDRVYGDVRAEVDNDFTQSEKVLELDFSPTVLVNDGTTNRIIGRIYPEDMEQGLKETEHNVRVLYWGGLLPSEPKWFFRHIEKPDPLAPAVLVDDEQFFYPYAGHWDNPITPSLDINFGVTRELRYSQNAYTGVLQITNANLFNLYHRNYFLEITDKDAKVMTALFRLQPTDINMLDFRDQIVIDNSYWRLNKVMNYNPFKEGLTKVELIKIKEPITFNESSYQYGRRAAIEDGLKKVVAPITKSLRRSNNIYPDFSGSVQGKNNRVGEGAVKFQVNGDNNKIGEGSTNITIFGNDNEVDAGLHNVQLINTNNARVNQSNVVYVNGKPQDSVEVLEGGEDTVRSLYGGTNIFIVEGGEDIVQTQFSDTAIYLIEGGQD